MLKIKEFQEMNTDSKLTNPAELKRVLPLAIAAYRDYWHYTCELALIDEDFDESLEQFDRDTWWSLSLSPEKADDYAVDCIESLNVAVHAFGEITEQAKIALVIVLKAILSLPPEKQNLVWGNAYTIEAEAIEEIIENLLIMLDEVEYRSPIDYNYEAFMKLLQEEWANFST